MKKGAQSSIVSIVAAVIFVWFLGWSLYWMGSKKEVGKPKQKLELEKIAFTVATPKEQYAT